MKAKIAAFGEKDVMLIFKAIGIEVFPVSKNSRPEEQLEKLVKEGYAVIFITENVALKINATVKKYMNKTLPSIVVIPGLGKKENFAVDLLRQAVVRAMGVDLFAEN
ncbi:MAG TPA: V-type ATP synthase subunit F [Actinobacteria bacterium]|nr:V-type ATP synthase subunit F [Actinomycetota bacterium]